MAETLSERMERETPVLAELWREHRDRALDDEAKYAPMVNDLWLPQDIREEAGRRLDRAGAALNALATLGHRWLYDTDDRCRVCGQDHTRTDETRRELGLCPARIHWDDKSVHYCLLHAPHDEVHEFVREGDDDGDSEGA